MTHGDTLNEENSDLVALFNMSQCVICSPVWRFVPRDRSAAKMSLRHLNWPIRCLSYNSLAV